MRRRSHTAYFLIFFVLLALMSLPKTSGEKLRGTAVALLAPSWQSLLAMKSFFSDGKDKGPNNQEELQKLRLENTRLRTEIAQMQEVLQQELSLVNQLYALTQDPEYRQIVNDLKKKHFHEWHKLLKRQLQAIPAHVIFRSPSSWNCCLWVDVGTANNEVLGQNIIAKNSPVVIGTNVIGVLDYVGEKQSRIRLITDEKLTPSVRALRDSSTYLAKGEVHGSSQPRWRSQRHLLHGTGFNYDTADSEGPAHDLNDPTLQIIQKGDLLVTTGMDGVFPPDLLVGEVTHVYPLKEGDYFYELEATPTAGNLDDLSLVFVLPSVGRPKTD